LVSALWCLAISAASAVSGGDGLQDPRPEQPAGIRIVGVQPVISNVAATATPSSATITWTTDKPSDSLVEYGTTKSFGNSSQQSSRVTSHVVPISGLTSNTVYYFRVTSREATGFMTTSRRYALTTPPAPSTPPPDTSAPTIALTAPANGAAVSGTIAVSATASDNVGVTGVQFTLDGGNLGALDTTPPYSISWNTTTAASGSHSLTATARDAAGNVTTSAAVSVTVSNSGVTTVALSPDDTSLNLNTTNYSSATTLTTYTWPDRHVANAILMKFDLSSLPSGALVQDATLTLALTESDATADPTYVISAHKIVGKNPVVAAATGYTTNGTAAWTANACCSNNVPMAQADIAPAYTSKAIDKVTGPKSWTITSMVQEWIADPGTNFGVLLNSDVTALADRFRYFASMEHADPALRPSLRVSYTVPPPDATPPSVAMSAPAAGALVSGTVTVSATANDNVSVASVQFQLDGANLGSTDTVAPYSISWNTTAVTSGVHALRAIARDMAGNTTTSSAITVTVSNTMPPPSNPWTNEPAGFTTVEETGWEAGTLGNWYRIFTSADKPISVATITGSLLGESRALQIDYPAGHTGGGGTELRFDIPAESRSSEVYVGFYVQVNPQWQGHSSGINKMVYLHDGGATFSAMWYEMFGSAADPLDLYVVNQSGSGPAGFHENVSQITFTRGQWHKVEIYQKQGDANNGIVRVWVNDILAIDRSDVDTRSSPLDNVTISGIWGGIGDSKNQADYMRFDRIRISRR
jgi:hypothetical protein